MDWFSIIALVAAVGLIAYVEYRAEHRRARRALRAGPPVSIRALARAGRGRVVGTVGEYNHKHLEAPLSGRRCVYYRLTVTEPDTDSPRTLIEERSVLPFVVEDSSGQAIIEPLGAAIWLVTDLRSSSGLLDEPNAREFAILRRHAAPATGEVLNPQRTYRESALAVGERVVVAGEVAAVLPTREGSKPRVILKHTDDAPLVLCNQPSELAR